MKRYISLTLTLIAICALVVPAYTLACTTKELDSWETVECNGCGGHPMGPDWVTRTTVLENQGDCNELSWVIWQQVENYSPWINQIAKAKNAFGTEQICNTPTHIP